MSTPSNKFPVLRRLFGRWSGTLKKVMVLSIGFLCIVLVVFLDQIFGALERYQTNLVSLILGVILGTYSSAIIYYKSEFLNEVEAVWSMLSSKIKPHEKHLIKQGAPVYDQNTNYLFDMQQPTTVVVRYDLGPQWYFYNSWKRGRLVEMYEFIPDQEHISIIFRARHSDLEKINV